MARGKKKAADAPPRTEEEAAQFRNDKEEYLVGRFVSLIHERRKLTAALAEVRQECSDVGLNAKVLQGVAKRQLESDAERDAREALEEEIATLAERLGQLADTPLGDAAQRAA